MLAGLLETAPSRGRQKLFCFGQLWPVLLPWQPPRELARGTQGHISTLICECTTMTTHTVPLVSIPWTWCRAWRLQIRRCRWLLASPWTAAQGCSMPGRHAGKWCSSRRATAPMPPRQAWSVLHTVLACHQGEPCLTCTLCLYGRSAGVLNRSLQPMAIFSPLSVLGALRSLPSMPERHCHICFTMPVLSWP